MHPKISPLSSSSKGRLGGWPPLFLHLGSSEPSSGTFISVPLAVHPAAPFFNLTKQRQADTLFAFSSMNQLDAYDASELDFVQMNEPTFGFSNGRPWREQLLEWG